MRNIFQKLFPVLYDYNPRRLHPRVANAVHNLYQKNYAAVELSFKGLSPADISLLNEGISELIDQDDLLDDWFDHSNGPALSCLLRGTILLKRAWVYRGWGRGHEVEAENFDRMGKALGGALRSLTPIMMDEKYGSEASARLIKVYKGLSADWTDIDEILQVMCGFEDVNLIGEINYLIASCEKWLGSHDKMFEFARERASQNPDLPELGALVAAAHFERHMYWERFDGNKIEANRYKKDPQIIEEITYYRDKLLEAYEPNKPEHVLAHNIFAGVTCDFNLFSLATPCFLALGDRVSPYPWDFLGEEYLQYGYNESMAFKKKYTKKG